MFLAALWTFSLHSILASTSYDHSFGISLCFFSPPLFSEGEKEGIKKKFFEQF